MGGKSNTSFFTRQGLDSQTLHGLKIVGQIKNQKTVQKSLENIENKMYIIDKKWRLLSLKIKLLLPIHFPKMNFLSCFQEIGRKNGKPLLVLHVNIKQPTHFGQWT